MAGAKRRGAAPVIGVMAVQGDFREHLDTLASIGAHAREVRLPEDLEGVSGLILPGGESTAMRKLYEPWNLFAALSSLHAVSPPILCNISAAIILPPHTTTLRSTYPNACHTTILEETFNATLRL